MGDVLKVAIVGVGHIAQHQIEAIAALKSRMALVGAYDRDGGVAAKFSGLCPFHASLDDLIASSPADLVVVSTPNRDHVHTARALLAAGRAVMVEKPVCENAADLGAVMQQAGSGFLHTALHAAFAPDLLWWLENRKALASRLGALTRIHMGFYDPYIEADGALVKGALGLGGSWYDSGINALSVLERIADSGTIRLTSAQMLDNPAFACAQVNGRARFALAVDGASCVADLDTDWTLGLNRKTSLLSYTGGAVILDHSAQSVVIREPGGAPQIVSMQNGVSRLTNQYEGVFADMGDAFARGADNRALSTALHDLLFAAADAGAKR